ncbi:zinc finger protein ztf-16-like isoform X2 [Anthonomus grandis grandis]|uniref:zinc finger protein ztf-16-like isoform X2 n=1 Tax=Anthonomus grandis grandis TaxID=2921223 RepID=UPI0021665AEC|nr:zinc finger protein ztf-16-like isoform X2 [Anthonomus grandis grandis]XP_050300305.1 zinc finger protein ztf-16-like isoform X2 [Anthonomus grandis grandis]XP_050300306.1 zinc finger protein ztf-16-like isoform X2 [Anthonomus grandis grandis]XP_050300307.1 zinc finger protein ztf-16-like isoform X2 [Anthonomus grandis grandis]
MIMANAATETEADSGSSIIPLVIRIEKQEDDVEDRVTGSIPPFESTESVHKCTRCDFEGSTASSLTNHITISHPPATNETEMEVAENNNPPADRVHRKMFECDVCNMKFSNGANMRRHKMRHTGVKPYECRVCQKRFFRKDHLAEHFTTHTKTLPYHCPICNRGFQRQIAMRAHFQNEHVGQHDLVKLCPLCNYRAGSMKSLRIHFFNRHGIDLDNPGAPGTQSQLIAAAAQQGFNPVEGALSSLNQLSTNLSVSVTSGSAANYSDSGDSTGNRSTDNATPPMHFLTPHVEISMADAPTSVYSPALEPPQRISQSSQGEPTRLVNGDSPNSPQSADSNSNAPSSSHIQPTSLRMEQETNITPSISLIPIKQEPGTEDYNSDSSKKNGATNPSSDGADSVTIQNATSSLSSLIKVSPLKSLLRDDLKRKLISRSNSRNRSTVSPNNTNSDSSPNDTNTIANGTITSTGPEQPSDNSLWRIIGKRTLQCIFCGIGFPDQTLYFLHKGCHSDANPWKCNICGEQCCNVYEFNSHLLSKSHQ